MKTKSNFIIGITAAALTFGTLMATLGPEHFNLNRHGCGQSDTHCTQSDNGKHCNTDNPESKTEVK